MSFLKMILVLSLVAVGVMADPSEAFLGIYLGKSIEEAEKTMFSDREKNKLVFYRQSVEEKDFALLYFYRGNHRLAEASFTAISVEAKTNRVYSVVVLFQDSKDSEQLMRLFRQAMEKRYKKKFVQPNIWKKLWRMHVGQIGIVLSEQGWRTVMIGAIHVEIHNSIERLMEKQKAAEVDQF